MYARICKYIFVTALIVAVFFCGAIVGTIVSAIVYPLPDVEEVR